MKVHKQVITTLEVPGFHQWDNAPAEVYYLGKPHRHLFRFAVAINVTDSDREVEFHLVRADITRVLNFRFHKGDHGYEFGGRSCEHLAEAVMAGLKELGLNVHAVEVWEDREHGSRVVADE